MRQGRRPDRASFLRIYEEGGIGGVAARYGTSEVTAYRWGRALGLELRKLRWRCPPREELVQAIRELGTRSAIAALYDVSGNTVNNWMRGYGLEPGWQRGGYRERRASFGRKKRRCLRCGGMFPSEGPHNRLCEACRRANRDVGIIRHRIVA